MVLKTEAGIERIRVTSESTVFIVDNDPLASRSLRRLVESVGLDVQTYSTASEFLGAYDPATPGCLVVEVRLPGTSGLDLLEQLAAEGAGMPTIVVTGCGDVSMAVRAMKSGAVDFIERPFKDQELLQSIQKGVEQDAKRRRGQAARLAVAARVDCLTPRERQVMDHVVVGKANKQTASELGCSGKTVEVHRARVMHKMQAGSVAELVRMAFVLEEDRGKP